jgi:pyruvate dehydrogenase E2 component (dihydrolipoamide acetyltransferase)
MRETARRRIYIVQKPPQPADYVHMSTSNVTDLRLAGNRRLRVRSWPGRGRPLVLLHGMLDSSEGWSQLVADSHRPAYAFDLPGFGGSELPTRPRLGAYAEDISAAVAQLGIADCTLVGHSLGGAVAALVAESSPAVSSLALIAPAGFGAIRLADAFALPGVSHVATRALPLALASPPVVVAAYMTFVSHRRLPPRELLGRVAGNAKGASAGVRSAILAMSHAGHAEDALHRRELSFGGPVAAVWGEHDALVPPAQHAQGLLLAAPHAHVEVWERMGHHPQRERPLDLARFIELRASRARRTGRRRSPLREAA